MNLKKLLLIAILSLIVQEIVIGQKNNAIYVDGYVIPKPDNDKLGSDTIYGKICFAKNIMGYEFYKIKLQLPNNEIIKIQASEIISFTRGIQYFESGYFDENYAFAERIIHGQISLFSNTQTSRNFTANNASSSYASGNLYIQHNSSKRMIAIPSRYKKFVEVMELFIKDDKELMTLIINKKLKSKDIKEIITRYNANYNGL